MSVAQEAAPGAVVLRTEHLGRRVGDVSIVTDVSLDVHQGEMLGIVGASGSGKSSFLRLLNRLDEPTSGSVSLDDQDYRQFFPRELRRRVGMVTQRPFLFPGNVAGNIRFGPLQRGEVLADEDIARLLERVGLPGFAGREVANLSGGEQQRVSLARALANRPEILLLDEPTSALDEQAKTGVEQLICSLLKDTSLTCVMVTHDRDQARRMCDRVALMEAGRLIQYGNPAEVLGA
jgi:putative ABC transport system ATP-binding protein